MTNGQIWVALIAAVPPTLAAVVGFALAWLKAKRLGDAVQEVHVQVNGRIEELVETTRALADAEGERRGRAHKDD